MNGKTHVALSLATIEIYMQISTKTSIFSNLDTNNMFLLAGVCVGSTAPDVDLKWNRNRQLEDKSVFQHRGITHTPIFLVGIIFLWFLYSYINPTFLANPKYTIITFFFNGFILGYFLHIIADCFTKMGSPLLYPFIDINKKISLTKMRTGGFAEIIILLVSISIILYGIYTSTNNFSLNSLTDLFHFTNIFKGLDFALLKNI